MSMRKIIVSAFLLLFLGFTGSAVAAKKGDIECNIDPEVEKLVHQMIGNKNLADVIAQNPDALVTYAALEEDSTFDNVLDNPTALRELIAMPRMNQARNNDKFGEWYDNLSQAQLEELWKNDLVRKALLKKLRHPGGEHEWCMVCEAPKLKKAGIDFQDIQRFRTKIEDLTWEIPDDYDDKGDAGGHGGKGSTRFHNELKVHVLKLVDTSTGTKAQRLAAFKINVQNLGERWNIDNWEEVYDAIWK